MCSKTMTYPQECRLGQARQRPVLAGRRNEKTYIACKLWGEGLWTVFGMIFTRQYLPLLLGATLTLGCLNSSNSGQDPVIVDGAELPPPTEQAEPGEVGFYVNARALLRARLEPKTLRVAFAEDFRSLDDTYKIDADTGGVSVRISRQDLTMEELLFTDERQRVTFSVLDEMGNEIASYDENLQLSALKEITLESPSPLSEQEVAFVSIAGGQYFLQSLATGEVITASEYNTWNRNPRENSDYGARVLGDDFLSDAHIELLKIPNEENHFVLRRIEDGEITYLSPYGNQVLEPRWLRPGEDLGFGDPLDPRTGLVFEVRAFRDGSVTLGFALSNTPSEVRLYMSDEGVLLIDYRNNPDESAADEARKHFRLLSGNLRWEIESLGAEFQEPIIPPGRIDHAFEDSISNCSEGDLTVTVGRDETRTTIRSISNEESLELYSNETVSVDVTVGVSAGFNAFGASVQASLEVSAGYEYSSSSTSTSSRRLESSEEDSITVSRERELIFEPYEAARVTDQVHVIDNFRVPYVQSFTLRAHVGTETLTGRAVLGQILANGFEGVPYEVGDDYVRVSVRGALHVDHLYRTNTLVQRLDTCEPR